jgi:hypothetical protein
MAAWPCLDAFLSLFKIRYVIPLSGALDAHLNLVKSRCVIPRSSGKPDLRF